MLEAHNTDVVGYTSWSGSLDEEEEDDEDEGDDEDEDERDDIWSERSE